MFGNAFIFIVSIIIVNNIAVFAFVVALAFSKHYRKVGQSFCGLARSFELDERSGSFLNSFSVCCSC